MTRIIYLTVIVIAIFLSPSIAKGQTPANNSNKTVALTDKQKIEQLIKSIETLKGCQFYRNGSWYSSSEAASHLKMKWGKAGSTVKTANDFIDKIATKSYMSGEAYKIKMTDGKEISTHDFLYAQLKAIEGK
jgi:hypothetical protein